VGETNGHVPGSSLLPLPSSPPATLAGRLARSPVVFTAACLVLVAALVPGAFLRGEVLSQGTLLYQHQPWQAHAPEDAAAANPLLHDAAYLFYPLLTHAVESVRRGEVPIWSAALYGGHPFLASFQTALFSPFTAIAFVVPLPHATVFKALAPLVVGGLGMFLFVRSLGLTTAAWWFAGLAYLLNGFAVGWMEHPLTAVVCWLPWILLATDALMRHGDGRCAAWLALFVSLAIFAGHPETTTKVLLLAGAYAVTSLLVDARRTAAPGAGRGRQWGMMLVAYGAGVLLTSVQVVPFVEYLSQSEAFLSREAASLNTYFLPAATLITGLVPDFFGNPAFGPYHVPPNRYGVVANYAEQALYAGVAVVLLAAAGTASRWNEWRVRFFAASGLVSLALMFGLPGLVQAISIVPFLRVMILTRFGIIAIFSLIVLAAYGVDRLTRPGHRWRPDESHIRRTVPAVAGAGAATVVAAWVAGLDFLQAHDLADTAGRAVVLAVVLLLIVSALVLLRVRGRVSPGAFALAICSVLVADLLVAGAGFHPTVPARQVYPRVPELDMVRRDPGVFRVYGWGNALVPNAAMAYGLQDARGWDGMNPDRFTRLLDLGYLRQASDPERHLRNPTILDLLTVRYVFVGPDVSLPAPRYTRAANARAPLYINTRALPRAFLVHEYRVLTDAELRAVLHDGSADLAQVALLEAELPDAERPEAVTTGASGAVEVRHYRDTFVELQVDAPARALLVLADAYYPGWKATVDGQPVRIRRTNYALRAVAVPAGGHVVRFEYRPLSLAIGASLSAVTLVGLVIVAVRGRARRLD
jgi:hypothetical protein